MNKLCKLCLFLRMNLQSQFSEFPAFCYFDFVVFMSLKYHEPGMSNSIHFLFSTPYRVYLYYKLLK